MPKAPKRADSRHLGMTDSRSGKWSRSLTFFIDLFLEDLLLPSVLSKGFNLVTLEHKVNFHLIHSSTESGCDRE